MSSVPQRFASWVIGSDASCDLVVNHPAVSGRHCRLSQYERGFALEDLGSTNGTFVDGQRINAHAPTIVTRQQQITLGRRVPLPWPPLSEPRPQERSAGGAAAEGGAARVIRIGRSPESDVVLDYPMISWEHARVVREGEDWILEDLNSRNGTSINQVQNRITRARLRPSDEVYLGSFKIAASRLLGERRTKIGEAAFQTVQFKGDSMVLGRDPQCDQPLDYPMISWHHTRISRGAEGMFVEDLGSRNGTFVNGARIRGRVRVAPGQEIGLGSFRFHLAEGGTLERREYHGNVSIEAAGVVVNAPDGHRLLDPVSMTVYPSELVALMGPSSAGKTTLLKALNGYTPPAQGQVLFNGANLYASYDLFRQQMGYVPQDDIVHSGLTVREALYFSTKLRTDLSDAEIERRIDKVLEELGLLDKKNSIIGSPERKVLSGGQRKRVNIAMELISDTPVLFLDEPTSGLSSYDAEGVVRVLKRLSREGKTIITTIHQPSIVVFRQFDDLIMISRDSGGCGAMVYFGPAYPDAIEFFDASAAPQAPAAREGKDKTPEALMTGLASSPTADWSARFAASPYHHQFVQDRSGKAVHADTPAEQKARRGFGLKQWLTLTRRNALLKIRDTGQLVVLLLQAPLFAALIAIVYKRLVVPTQDDYITRLTQQISGIHFLMVVAAIWFGCNNAARDIVGEWSIFQRERMVNLKLPSYVFSKLAVLFGLCVFQCVALLGIVTVFCGLTGSFFQTASVLVVASLVGTALGLAISARATTTESAIALLPVVLLPIIALGGGLSPIYKMRTLAQTASYMVPSRWAFEANVLNEANHHDCDFTLAIPIVECDASRGGGVDAAESVFPKWSTQVNDQKLPAKLEDESQNLRHSYGQSMATLAVMLAALLSGVLVALRLRDVH
jgi:ABC-type multidrug transport system ATPase subunit/pSer/pThr/pTyr-binding forkhead associated (FHA) protein/ABC-type multidrug transport system permease subunit